MNFSHFYVQTNMSKHLILKIKFYFLKQISITVVLKLYGKCNDFHEHLIQFWIKINSLLLNIQFKKRNFQMVMIDSLKGKIVLMTAHVAGMIDFVALPIWVGVLMPYYHLNPQAAGALVTLFLAGIVVSNLVFGPKLNKVNARIVTPIGYSIAAAAFMALSFVDSYLLMAILHMVAGIGAGCGLTFTHGTIGKSKNPHRLFGIMGLGMGIFGILYFGFVPRLITEFGASVFFRIFSGLMVIATIATAVAFPTVIVKADENIQVLPVKKIPKVIWIAIVGMIFMSITHATVFSFVERIGFQNNFSQEQIYTLFLALGTITIIPSIISFFVQDKFNPFNVIILGPIIQLAAILVVTNLKIFEAFSIATALMPCIFIFTHIFFFGLLSKLETSGRAASFTPSILMIGSAIGPILGGTFAHLFNYQVLGFIAMITVIIAVYCFIKLKKEYDIKQDSSLAQIID